MNLKNNRGVVGIDVSVALVVILLLLPIIIGMIYNINKSNANIKRKSQALNIAINCMETFKAQEDTISDLTIESLTELIKNNCNMDNNNIITRDSIQYKVELRMYEESNESVNISTKQLTANVKYKSGTKEQSVKLSTAIKYNNN